jgi:hypothetical protein
MKEAERMQELTIKYNFVLKFFANAKKRLARDRRLATLDIPCTHLITQVKQRSTWMGDRSNDKYAGAVRRCTRILWPGMVSEKTPRGVITPVCVKYRRTPQEKTKFFFC